MQILVTGAAGFAGQYLIRELLSCSHTVIATDALHSVKDGCPVQIIPCDILDTGSLNSIVKSTHPDACVHLAAIAYVPHGKTKPAEMFNINITGTINVLEAFKAHSPEARILTVSTAHVYGTAGDDAKLSEDSPFSPSSLYAISKACADRASLAYAGDSAMNIMVARPNNHTGPGQSPSFAVPAFASKIKESIKNEGTITTGNLESIRDFSDVRDVVRAYRLILEKGRPGSAYNISSHHFWKMRDIFDYFCRLGGKTVKSAVDPALARPADRSPALDTTRIEKETGWMPQIPFEKTLSDIWELL